MVHRILLTVCICQLSVACGFAARQLTALQKLANC